MRTKEQCLLQVFWKNYTYKVGRSDCKGTQYFADKRGKVLYAQDPYHARRKDGAVRMNEIWAWATQL